MMMAILTMIMQQQEEDDDDDDGSDDDVWLGALGPFDMMPAHDHAWFAWANNLRKAQAASPHAILSTPSLASFAEEVAEN